jgi:Uma2 family endonuclease
MLSVLEEPAYRARIHPISVDMYHRMILAGALEPNVELIRGALFEKMPKSPLHASIVVLLAQYAAPHLPSGYHLRSEQPLTFSDSEPEPDIAIVAVRAVDFFESHPTTAALVAEVSVTSEAVDRLKLQVYAEAGVPECWLVLAEARCVERYTEPEGLRYRKVERVNFPATLTSTVFPQLAFSPADLFPG